MNYTLQKGRWCNLDKYQMSYVNTIALTVQDLKHLPNGLNQILDHLYLGNWEDAVDAQNLKSCGITHVINTVDKLYENCRTGKEFYGAEMEYLGFTSEDDENYDIMKHFDDVYNFIEDARVKGGKCFIHCIAGINRSGCLATAYVMLHKNIGPISAAKMVWEQRGCLLSNNGFIERLVKFAIDRNMLELDKDNRESRFGISDS